MKKKVILGLALSMLITMAAPVIATGSTLSKEATSDSIKVEYTITDGYQIVIPPDLNFQTNLTLATSVEATNVLVENGKVLKVTMESDNGYKLVCNGSEIAYTVSDAKGEITANPATVLEVKAGTTTGETDLTFATTTTNIANATKSGQHTDKLTFTCSIEVAATN